MALAVDVSSKVLGGPSQLEQSLFEGAALGRVDHCRLIIDLVADEATDRFGSQHLGEHGLVRRHQDESEGGVLLDAQPAVTRHRLGDVDEESGGHRITGVPHEGVDDLFGVVPSGHRIPQTQWGQSVGVDVFGSPFQLRKGGDGMTALVRQRVIHLQQEGAIGLDNEGAG